MNEFRRYRPDEDPVLDAVMYGDSYADERGPLRPVARDAQDKRLWATQVGMYGQAPARAAAELETASRQVAVLMGISVTEARAKLVHLITRHGLSLSAAQSKLEYRWHYDQARALGESLSRPDLAGNRRTVHIWGKPYHWLQLFGGRLELRPGASPW